MLLIGALALLTVGLTRSTKALPGPVTLISLPPSVSVAKKIPLDRSIPVRLQVPALHISVRLISLGLNRDGTVQVPKTVTQVGWYRFGVTPGQIGSAVLLGHVDSYRGPGIFFGLRTLVPGNRIKVTLTNGRVATFRVTAVRMFSKHNFPALKVYGSHGYSGLQLVTCGGQFNSVTHSYESNIVVFSKLV